MLVAAGLVLATAVSAWCTTASPGGARASVRPWPVGPRQHRSVVPGFRGRQAGDKRASDRGRIGIGLRRVDAAPCPDPRSRPERASNWSGGFQPCSWFWHCWPAGASWRRPRQFQPQMEKGSCRSVRARSIGCPPRATMSSCAAGAAPCCTAHRSATFRPNSSGTAPCESTGPSSFGASGLQGCAPTTSSCTTALASRQTSVTARAFTRVSSLRPTAGA